MKKIVLFLSFLVFSLVLVNNSLGYGLDKATFSNGVSVDIEIASMPSELRRGLMYRESLPESRGMLFIMDSEDLHSFWMKNMNFAVDMIWIDSDFTVVDVTRDAEPCDGVLCEGFSPDVPAAYVLEVPAGYALRQGVDVGVAVVFSAASE